jgi:uncharacterized membrane protein YbhN (UPF0104 family)
LFLVEGAVAAAVLIGAGLALILGARGPHDFTRGALPTLLAIAVMLPVAALPLILRLRPHAPRWVRGISAGVEEAKRVTCSRGPSWRLAGALASLCFDIAVIWVCLRALGHTPGVAALVMAYSIGYLGAMAPIPAGLGVLDAGLTGALVLYGVAPAHAAAAVVIYHAIALWVPGLGGIYAYVRLRPRLLRAKATADPSLKDHHAATLEATSEETA